MTKMTPLVIRLDKTIEGGRVLRLKNCNLACIWCHGDFFNHAVGEKAIDNKNLASLVEKVAAASKRPNVEIKITGQGEPCLAGKEEICDLILRLKKIPKVRLIKMVTNGILLDKMAGSLKDVGLDGLTVSLHSLKPDRYKKITGENLLNEALKGIEAAVRASLKIKLNLIYCQINADEVWDYIKFAEERNIDIKFFDLLPTTPLAKKWRIPINNLCQELDKGLKGKLSKKLYYFYEYASKQNPNIAIRVKVSELNNCPNLVCKFRELCLEGCRSSVRISQDGVLHPCGARTDNTLSLVDKDLTSERIREALQSGGKE